MKLRSGLEPGISKWMLLLLCSGFGIFYLVFTHGDLSAGFTSDDAVYLLLADLYSFGTATQLPVYQIVREQALFPPLFPMLLGLSGGGSADLAQSSLITVSCLVLALALAALWIMQQLRNPLAALLPAAALFLMPGTLVLSQEIWSEFLFMVWLYLILIIAGRDSEIKHHWLILSVLIALTTLTRTAGVALIPPFLLLLYRSRGQGRRSWLPAMISSVPFVAWYLPREWLRESPGYTRTLTLGLQDTGSSLLHALMSKLTALFESLRWLFATVESNSIQTGYAGVVLILLLLVAGTVFFQRLKELRFDALFCASYVGMVMVWPYAEVYYVSRLIYPVIPLFLLYAMLGMLRPGRNGKTHYPLAAVFIFSFAVVAGPSLQQIVSRGLAEVEPGLKPYRNDRTWMLAPEPNPAMLQNIRFIVETLGDRIPNTVSEQDCLYAFQPPFVMLHTKRVSGVLPPPDVSDEQFKRDTTACRYIVALPITDLAGHIPEYYPLQRTGDDYTQTAYYQHSDAQSGTAVFLLRKIADTIPLE